MLNLSTQAKLRLQDNQKVYFKADFTLDMSNGRNSSLESVSLDGKNLNYGENKSYAMQHSNSSTGFYLPTFSTVDNWNCDFRKIPFVLFRKRKYIVISAEIYVDSPSGISYIRPYFYDIHNDGTKWTYSGDNVCTPISNGEWTRVYQVCEASHYLNDPSIAYIDCMGFKYLDSSMQVPSTPFTDVDYNFRNIMFELNDTGVPSDYVDSYVYYGGSYTDFLSSKFQLNGDDVMSGSATITDATSSSGSFDIGSAIINSLNITLNNFDDRFSLYDFTGATMKVYIGVPLVDFVDNEDDPTQIEWVVKGFYTVDKPTSIGNTIPLTMLDNMSKFEVLFKDVPNIIYPATLDNLIKNICLRCGVVQGTSVPNPNWTISQAPEDENLTCLDMISYIAQLNGCYARMNNEGYLTFGWYNFDEFDNDSGDDYDGGTFLTQTTPYSDGDNLDGGEFDFSSQNYIDEEGIARVRYANPTEDYDGGHFAWGRYHVIYAFTNYSVATEDIEITGIQYKVDNTDESSSESEIVYLYDKNGSISSSDIARKQDASVYALEISGNKLMPFLGDLPACMDYIARKLVGIKFRPYNITTLSNPQYEAGDVVKILDNKGNDYYSVITSLSYPLNGYETLNCDAETVNEHGAIESNNLSTAIASVKNDTSVKLSNYDKAVRNLSSLSANALGFYESSIIDDLTGSRIEYMHDQPALEDSLNAYKKTMSGFFIGNRDSIDDDFTWVSGVDMTGNAVYKTLTAHGISADWIVAGTIDGDVITTKNLKVNIIETNKGDASSKASSLIDLVSSSDTRLVFGTSAGYPNGCNIMISGSETGSAGDDGFGVMAKENHGTETAPVRSGLWQHHHSLDYYWYDVYYSTGHWGRYRTIDFRAGTLWSHQNAVNENGFWRMLDGSDRRLKTNIKDIPKTLIRKLFEKIRFKTFEYNNDVNHRTNYGLIAQDVENIFDELGIEKRNAISKDDDGYYGLAYEHIDRFCIPAVKDLYEICNKQQEEINLLKKEIAEIKNI